MLKKIFALSRRNRSDLVMMNVPNFITVWEWEVQPCLWVPFTPKMSCYIENAFRQSEGSVDLGIENQELACFTINFSVLRQVNTITNESTRVRQQQYPFTCPLAKGILWMWWSDFRWELYDVLTSMHIEDEFQKHSQGIDLSLSPLHIPNIINFTNMVQTNKETKTSRKIERHKTTEQYPVAVVHRQPMTNFPPAPVTHPLQNTLPMNGTYGQPTCAIPRSPQHVQDRNDDILGSTPPRKKMKTLHGGPLGSFTIPVIVTGQPDDECAICLENLTKPSEYDLTDPGNPPADIQCVSPDILQLIKCKHLFHRICLQKMYNSGVKDGCLQCPTCKAIHGVKKGNQPSDGTMDVETNMIDIPGYPGCGSILIVYNFIAGVQGENHPNPGQPYTTNSFPRTCYLPNNILGQKVLRLLKKAFERQLIFTIGMSVTTGVENTVVWNDIHHKTEGYQNRSGFGYPDPNYLDNVLAELASHGVTDDDDE